MDEQETCKGLFFDGKSHVEIPASKTTDDYQNGFTYLLWIKPTEPPPNVNTCVIERDWHNPTIQIGPTDFYASIAVNADQAATHSVAVHGSRTSGAWMPRLTTVPSCNSMSTGEMVEDKVVGKVGANPPPATSATHQVSHLAGSQLGFQRCTRRCWYFCYAPGQRYQ